MACFHPWVLNAKPMACGRCHGCRMEYARQWAIRCVHESKLYDFNVFVTLSYKDLPKPCFRCREQFDVGSLHYCDFQLFMKRLRETGRHVRFFMSGEYGDRNGRPHYHALLFNCWFDDMKYWRVSESGHKLYRSKELEELWPLGSCEIGMVTFESAAYVARYCMKKYSGDGAKSIAEIIDPDSLAVVRRVKPFARMSLKPGVGKPWLNKFYKDVFPFGSVVVNGKEQRAPKYYDNVCRMRGFDDYMRLANARRLKGEKFKGEIFPGRLSARSKVAEARLNILKGE